MNPCCGEVVGMDRDSSHTKQSILSTECPGSYLVTPPRTADCLPQESEPKVVSVFWIMWDDLLLGDEFPPVETAFNPSKYGDIEPVRDPGVTSW